jgi:hypothetical protein
LLTRTQLGPSHAFRSVWIPKHKTGCRAEKSWNVTDANRFFQSEIAATIVVLVLLVLAPLLLFSGHLVAAQRQGINEYSPLASRYVAEFDRKWIRAGAPAEEPLVGSADSQSLADLVNSFDVIQRMRAFPFSWGVVIQLVVTVALPILPLLLTMFPLDELLVKLAQVLL